MDEYFSFLIYSSLRSGFLDFFASIFNTVFSFPMFFAFLVIFYVVSMDSRRFIMVFSMLVSSAIAFLVKKVVNRPRPQYGALNVLSLNPSFPSGHTAGVFAVAAVLSHYYPKHRHVFYLFGILTAFFRVYSGVHYVSDVLFGAFFGWAVGRIVLRYRVKVEHLNKKIQEYIR